ncbi:ATP-binding protein [Streptomyces luteogriseus]|uniref:ATP-binding protein n=1 Tax=Streptomyces luteogriseus TaxID=68233 RepID=UPI002E2ECF6E|nr:ATP-binding protein [Streptomyces luteogriseus]WTJ25638.1 ATP-binding protein [Streptomyces luteogriseus]
MSPHAPSPQTDRPAAQRVHTCRLPHNHRAPGVLREWLAGLLTGQDATLLGDDLALVATELATNALRHGSLPVHVSLTVTHTGNTTSLRLETIDFGDGFGPDTTPRAPEDLPCRGRGLQIVAALTRAWGHIRLDHGHLVWAELAATRA